MIDYYISYSPQIISFAKVLGFGFLIFGGLAAAQVWIRQVVKNLPANDFLEPLEDWLQNINRLLLLIVSLYISSWWLAGMSKITSLLLYVTAAGLTYYLMVLLFKYLDLFFKRLSQEKEAGTQAILYFAKYLSKAILVVVLVLFLLSNFGINVSSLVAGIGIGGIAIALAVQNILGDLFSAFAILLDQPFTVGDFIVTGEYKGTVEKIGIKTTRIRSLKGEEIIIPNKELTASVVQNFRTMKKRRTVFKVGVVYETDVAKLKKIPKIIEEVVSGLDNTEFKRAHLVEMGDYALIFEVVYELDSKDYKLYVDRQQEIIIKILEKFSKEKIEIAYPTQIVQLKKP
ncbi:MAG: mechanosensitive ion channel [bacterium]|nr:mechanosensitive ion channel [bacterium]